MRTIGFIAAALVAVSGFADIRFETQTFRLTVGDDAKVKSLVIAATGEEMVDAREGVPLFSVTQERPFNNEIKLMHPNKRTVYPANSLKLEDGRLRVGFETIAYGAFVSVKKGRGYLAFTLDGFDCQPEFQYESFKMDTPPACEFRIAQLPVRERTNFGDWLNAMWDERGAVAVVGCDPYASVDHADRAGFRILSADVFRGLKLKGGSAALVAGAGREAFLDEMEAFERDFGLPPGVRNRRAPDFNRSVIWTWKINPANVDEYIGYCRRSGISRLQIFYRAIFKGDYDVMGDYDLQDCYGGLEGVKAMLAKLKAAGITPGLHVLQTWIGARSRYVTPVLDPRLGKKRLFTLSKPIAAETADVGEVFVEEDPADSPIVHAGTRVLAFGGEAFTYENYVTERPYRFTGVKRGHFATAAAAHPRGEIGGILDISEYATDGIYLDQRSSLQEEVAEKIRAVADCGFEFFYFDGSEGVQPPCGLNVALSQMRVAGRLAKAPLYTEGAAKTHFGWHLQAGGNAFDSFPPEFFKKTLVRFQMAEAPMMRKDFTRINFGWWTLTSPGDKVQDKFTSYPYRELASIGMQPDMWEFGTSRAAAWDCPITFNVCAEDVGRHPRIADLMETIRRWEDVRARNWLTPGQKEALKSTTQEHHLYLNEKGEYELVPWTQIRVAGDEMHHGLRAFVFERAGKRVVAYWHTSGCGKFRLADGRGTVVEASHVKYYETDDPVEAVTKAFAEAEDAGEPGERTQVLFNFDTEDYTADYPNDAVRDLANLLTEEGVIGQFYVVGYLAERLREFGRQDVIDALKPHVVGSQSLYHSRHPALCEQTDIADADEARRRAFKEEEESVRLLRSVLGRGRIDVFCPPGNSVSYAAMEAYADLGMRFYAGGGTWGAAATDGTGAPVWGMGPGNGKALGYWYFNMYQIPYLHWKTFYLEHMLLPPAPEPDFKAVLDKLAKMDYCGIYMHPNQAVCTEFWDVLNYNGGKNLAPWGKWNVSPRRSAEDTATAYRRLRAFIRALKADGRFRITNLREIEKTIKPRRTLSRSDVSALKASLDRRLGPVSDPGSYCVADAFLAAVAFLRGEERFEPGRVYGFLSAPVGVKAAVRVSAADLKAAAERMDVSRYLPTEIPVGSVRLGPADFLFAALEVLATGADEVTVTPRDQLGSFADAPGLEDLRIAGSDKWCIHSPDFKDEYLSDRLRYQLWTARYE